MPDLYGNFGTGPVYGAADPNDQIAAAFDMPMNLGATFWDQAKGGALESFGLGTEIRRAQTPEGNLQALSPAERLQRQEEGIPNPLRALRGLGQTLGVLSDEPSDTSAPLSQEQWKTSPFYRESVPYDAAMTEARAEALAQWNDAAKVREYFATKRPITSFLGNIAGQAVDPINYIPIAGAIVKEASILRTALSGAGDAAANTAMFGIASRDARARYGDDVSWQATVSEIATAALIGGAFGAAAGALDNVLSSRASARAQRDLQTLKTTQEARIALNEAIDAVAHGEPVKLSPNAVDAIRQKSARLAPETPALETNRASSEALADAIAPTQTVTRVVDQSGAPLKVYHGTGGDFALSDMRLGKGGEGQFADAEGVIFFTSDRRVAGFFSRLPSRRKVGAPNVKEAFLDIRNPAVVDFEGKYKDTARVQQAIADAKAAGHDGLHIRNVIDGDQAGPSADTWVVFDPKQISDTPFVSTTRAAAAPATVREIPQPQIAQVSPPQGYADSQKSVGKSEDLKALASQHAVDPNTGDFPEVAEVEQLRLEGRLTDDDLAELADAEVTMQDADAYAEAFKAVTRCLL